MAASLIPKTYDPKTWQINYGGTIMNTNVADGTFISIVQSNESFEETTGADGSENRTNKNENGVTIEYTCQQVSEVNDQLTIKHDIDKVTNLGVQQMTIKDLIGGSTVTGLAYIKKKPDTELSNTMGNRTWIFRIGFAINYVGGSFV